MSKLILKKAKTYSQTGRAAYQRNSRETKFNERRFNNPLRAFIQHKYPVIFNEYSELYEQLRAEYPHRKSLERTTMFRQWLETETPSETPPPCDIITQALQETLGSDVEQEEQQLQPLRETNDSDEQQDPQLPPQEQGPSQLYHNIDELLNEMAANPNIGDILEQQETQEDKGIELNLYDEVCEDIQPLDYTLEVELGEF